MKLYTIGKQSLGAIFANKGRSFLTVLGIVIGIGSVIALMSLGNGVKESISGRISNLGATKITISNSAGFGPPSSQNSSGSSSGFGQGNHGGQAIMGTTSTLTVDDYKSLSDKTKNPNVIQIAGTVSGSAIYNSDQKYNITGTTLSYFDIEKLKINTGQVFTEDDITNKTKVIVLGSQLKENLFGSEDTINKTLTIEKVDYKVIGVFEEADESGFSNPNSASYIPYTSAMETLGTEKFNSMTAMAKDEGSVDQAKADMENILLTNHGISDKKLADFSLFTSADLLSTVGDITGILTSLLAGIAAISLLVGGIGIMNIMLVSVTERTREIGLRKAVGAKTSDILIQFLIEALLLTLVGGLLGIGLGAAIGTIASKFIGFSAVMTNSSIFLAVGISVAIGIIFGIYPAARAAKLNPIDALRYE